MFLVGLTGGIASGKSTVSKMLNNLGCVIIDADQIAKDIMLVGEPAYKKTIKIFGDQILNDDKTINRDILGAIIFNDTQSQKKLNSITHPKIAKIMFWKIVKNFLKGKRYLILDVPLLIESKFWLKLVKYVVVVDCNIDIQLQRLIKRNNYSKEEAESRINSQMKLSEKKKFATNVIDNNFSFFDTKNQVGKLHSMFKKTRGFSFYEILLCVVLLCVWLKCVL